MAVSPKALPLTATCSCLLQLSAVPIPPGACEKVACDLGFSPGTTVYSTSYNMAEKVTKKEIANSLC